MRSIPSLKLDLQPFFHKHDSLFITINTLRDIDMKPRAVVQNELGVSLILKASNGMI